MFETLKEFVVTLRGDVDKDSFDEMGSAVDSVSDKVVGFAQAAAGALAAGAFAMAIRQTVDRFNDLGDVAERMGNTTVEELDRLGYVAELTGSDAGTAAASFENLSKTIGEAAAGVGRGAKVFEDFGLSAKNADGSVKSVGQVMDDLRGKLDGLSAAEQQATIQRLGLDRTMIGMLTSDTREIEDEYRKRTEALGVNADEMAERSGAFNDAIGMMTRASSDVFTSFVQRILPSLTRALDTVARFINDNAALISQYVEPIADAFDFAVTIVTNFIKTIASVVSALGPLGPAVMVIVAAFKALNLIMSMNPFARVVTAIGAVISAIGLLVDDFQTAREGGKSFFTFWGPLINVVNSASEAFDRFMDRLRKSGAFDNFIRTIVAVKDTITASISTVFGVFKVVTGAIASLFTGNIDYLRNAWSDLVGSLKSLWEGYADFFPNLFAGIDKVFDGFFSNMYDGVVKWIDDAIAAFVEFVKAIPKMVQNAATDFIGGIGDKLKGMFGFSVDGDAKEATSAPAMTLAAPVPVATTMAPSMVTSSSTVTNHVTF